jgi:hypothetical protein
VLGPNGSLAGCAGPWMPRSADRLPERLTARLIQMSPGLVLPQYITY